MKDHSERCYICGGSTYKCGWYNGWTDRTYCVKCRSHLHDDEPTIREDGQMLLDVEEDK